jgi:hypothetical protein
MDGKIYKTDGTLTEGADGYQRMLVHFFQSLRRFSILIASF